MARSLHLMVAGVFLCISSLALAGAMEDYQTLFGQDEKAAAGNIKEAAPFAAKLLGAAKAVGDQQDLQVILCEKAYEFGMKEQAGYTTAIDAMKLLMEASPEKKAKARASLLKVQQLRYAKSTGDERKHLGNELVDAMVAGGDDELAARKPAEANLQYRQALNLAMACGSDRVGEIMDKIKQAAARIDAEKIRTTLLARLEKNPKDSSARTQLLLLCLSESNETAEAEKLLTDDVDKNVREHAVLAIKPVDELDETACMDLAEWYSQLAGKSSAAGKAVLQGKAAACCERYLTLHTSQDAGRLKAQKLLDNMPKSPGTAPKVVAAPTSPGVTPKAGGDMRSVTMTTNGVPIKLIFIPPGEFVMGSPASEIAPAVKDQIQHKVKITREFAIGETEITQAQWLSVMQNNPSDFKGDDLPVENISAEDAMAFCGKLTKSSGKTVRLPTEAEWEYACRAGTTTTYHSGDNITALAEAAWYRDNSNGRTHPVRQKKPNPWGLYDMHGNVWEYCSDWAKPYPPGDAVDPTGPTGPASGQSRVLRGGSWGDPPNACRAGNRAATLKHFPNAVFGFRIALDDPPAGVR